MSTVRKAYEAAGCSPAAYDAALEVNLYTRNGDHPINIIAATTCATLGLDRMICLRDVLRVLHTSYHGEAKANWTGEDYAELIERRFIGISA